MIKRAQTRRHGRGTGLRGLLVERVQEFERIQERLEQACGGRGGVTLIEAPAGKGKSRLLTIAGDLARECGMQVLGAQATELERDFPFGLAIQLFEPRWVVAGPAEREHLLRGPARHAGDVLAGLGPAPGSSPADLAFNAVHGFYWLAINLLLDGDEVPEMRPMALLVDDVQWADQPSLRLLAYLAERIPDAPLALIVTLRAGELSADEQAVAALRRVATGATLRPGSLTNAGVTLLVQDAFPDAEPEFCKACAALTNGNPFLLTELLAQLQADRWPPTAATAARLADSPPESVMRAVVARLEALPPESALVARAVSVWGAGATTRVISQLTHLPEGTVARAADVLSAVHLFHPGSPLGFVHPLIASAVRSSISPLDRGRMHTRCAGMLIEAGSPPEPIAAHLLNAPAQGDARAVAVLRAAAQKALASDAPESAVRMLERALAEDPDTPAEPELLAELAEAESAAGMPTAVGRLTEALSTAQDGPLRTRLALAHGRALYELGGYREAVIGLEQVLSSLQDTDSELSDEIASVYLAAAFFVPELRGQAHRRARSLVQRLGARRSRGSLDALAHMAVHGSLHGERRDRVIKVARLAWADGALLSASSIDGLAWPLVAGAMLFVGELEFALEICNAALAHARALNSPAGFAAASSCRACVLFELGRITEAAADAQAGLDARPDGWRRYLRSGYSVMACCHIEMGELERAETALSILDHPHADEAVHVPSLLEARAQLRLAQRRPQEALADALAAGARLRRSFGITGPGAVPWRSTAALAHLAARNVPAAQKLASEELEAALGADIPHLIARNLRILGLCEGGEAGLELLDEAVRRRSASTMPRLEDIRSDIEYGAALRRANRRTAARSPLRHALELAHAGGASVLEQRATEELLASGARKARVLLSGVEALTPSERRVADFAARGLTTRQIAESLFVTPKTVEFHLRHIYQKLDVNSRPELAELLSHSGQPPDVAGGLPPGPRVGKKHDRHESDTSDAVS